MDGFPIEIVLALAGVAVPIAAFLYEFVVVGRRRLGYRVQMDTPVTGEIESVFPGVLTRLRPESTDGATDLKDLSVVLVRIENSGATTIDTSDYQTLDNGRAGLHLHFPRRRVIGMAVTELSHPGLAECLDAGSGIAHRWDASAARGVIDLPKVPLNRGDHYKVLAILQRHGRAEADAEPELRGGVKGGRVLETRSRSGASRPMFLLVGFLVLVIAAQLVVGVVRGDRPPRGCVGGELTVVGSSALRPVIQDAAERYRAECHDLRFTFAFEGTERGLDRLTRAAATDGTLIAIGDNPIGANYPKLDRRSLAVAVFTVVTHPDLDLPSLSTEQLRDIYAGRVTDWSEVGGPPLPVVLVERAPGSGTRAVFEQRVLGGSQPAVPHTSCLAIRGRELTGPTRCTAEVTGDLLQTVRDTRGAIGYSEFGEATRAGLRTPALNGVAPDRQAALAGRYELWGIEFAYSYGAAPPGSPAAAFLRYLTDEGGTDVLRAHGNEPCRDLPNPARCGDSG